MTLRSRCDRAALSPQSALPVRTRTVTAERGLPPAVSRVRAESTATGPVVTGTVLRVEGARLRGAITNVRVGGIETSPPDAAITEDRITVALPAGVPAGVRGLQVVHLRSAGTPPIAESNLCPVVVRPVVDGEVTTQAGNGRLGVVVPVSPPVGTGQQVVLMLNEFDPPPDRPQRGYRFAAPAGRPGPAGTLTVPTRNVEPGRYLVRLRVDGAESVLGADEKGTYKTPLVTVP